MAPRSRKRGRRKKPRSPPPARAHRRRGRPAATAQARSESATPPSGRAGSARPGRAPWSIKIAALIALIVGVGDLSTCSSAAGSFGGTHTAVGGVIVFSVLMIICGLGMWQLRYWAVLGFQAVLAIVF